MTQRMLARDLRANQEHGSIPIMGNEDNGMDPCNILIEKSISWGYFFVLVSILVGAGISV